MIVIRPIRSADIAHVAANARDADRREGLDLFGYDVLEGLTESVKASSWCAAIEDDEELIALVGVAAHELLTTHGAPWMIGVNGIEKHGRAFVRMTQPIIGRMLDEYPLLSNIVHSENALSVRWLKRAGFTFGALEPVGQAGAMGFRFWKARPGWVFSQQSARWSAAQSAPMAM